VFNVLAEFQGMTDTGTGEFRTCQVGKFSQFGTNRESQRNSVHIWMPETWIKYLKRIVHLVLVKEAVRVHLRNESRGLQQNYSRNT
jgi:hypothetical protein